MMLAHRAMSSKFQSFIFRIFQLSQVWYQKILCDWRSNSNLVSYHVKNSIISFQINYKTPNITKKSCQKENLTADQTHV